MSLLKLLKQDLKIALAEKRQMGLILSFFILAAMLFPFGLGTAKAMLQDIGPAIIWVLALFASTLTIDQIFDADWTDGSLDQLLLSGASLTTIAYAKALAHWLMTAVPLIIITPLVGVLFYLDTQTIKSIMLTLIIGTPSLSLLGTIMASLVLGARRLTVFVPFMMLPLTIPILIFSVAMVGSADHTAHLMLLTGLFLIMMVICPWATIAGLRLAQS